MRRPLILDLKADCSSFGLEGLRLPCKTDYQKALEEIVKEALGSDADRVETELKSDGLGSILKSTRTGKERFSFSNFTEVIKKATREAYDLLNLELSDSVWEILFRGILQERLEYYIALPLGTLGLRVYVRVVGEEENHFKVCVTAERWKMTFEEDNPDDPSMEANAVWGLTLEGKVLVADSLGTEAATVILTPIADCSSFGLEGLPLPGEGDYRKALEEIVKDALGPAVIQKIECKLVSDGLCSILKSTRTGRERLLSSDLAEVIKKATREAFFKCEQMLGAGTSTDRWEFWFRRILHQQVEGYLAQPLKTQGLRVCVRVMGGEEENHFKVCVTAERWKMTFEEDDPDDPSIEANAVWGLTLEGKVLVADSLETEAAVVVAKALADRGEEGLSQLECPEKIKDLIRNFMDKKPDTRPKGFARGLTAETP